MLKVCSLLPVATRTTKITALGQSFRLDVLMLGQFRVKSMPRKKIRYRLLLGRQSILWCTGSTSRSKKNIQQILWSLWTLHFFLLFAMYNCTCNILCFRRKSKQTPCDLAGTNIVYMKAHYSILQTTQQVRVKEPNNRKGTYNQISKSRTSSNHKQMWLVLHDIWRREITPTQQDKLN